MASIMTALGAISKKYTSLPEAISIPMGGKCPAIS